MYSDYRGSVFVVLVVLVVKKKRFLFSCQAAKSMLEILMEYIYPIQHVSSACSSCTHAPMHRFTDPGVAAGEKVVDWWGINYYSRSVFISLLLSIIGQL